MSYKGGKTGAQKANELRDWLRDYGPGKAATDPSTPPRPTGKEEPKPPKALRRVKDA